MIVRNGHAATMDDERTEPYGAVRDALVAVQDGRIAWIGPAEDAPTDLADAGAATVVDLDGGWVTPGLIDAHTHLVFGGDRAYDFEQRLAGATYEEIARAGGGILSTVAATRAASERSLVESAAARLDTLIDHGATTVEVKSGYGLDLETELRMLRVARELEKRSGVTVSATLLAAHALPPEFRDDRAAYLELVCTRIIPEAARLGLADAVDAFCEGIAFTPGECARVLSTGREHGLAGRLHADQLSDLEGAIVAASAGARSADHLEYTGAAGVAAMADAGTAAVLLPGAFYYLSESQRPPIAALRAAGVPMVVATDLNPGTSPLRSPLMAMNLACIEYGLTPEEALVGMTRNAAPVLGFTDRGILRPGARADLACWDMKKPSELSYWLGGNPCMAVFSAGRRLR